ncbi:MAG: glutathione S-transferase family protein, partial [Candidatus Marinimicrobia bacterium]|nr:glutathione S-transferase family protein [Candidatus Neomarinimicrobiota bacterium]
MDLKIVYLDLPFWRAEVARLALFIADVKFDDLRINSAEFSYLQENGKLMDGTLIPFNQLPVLVINGQSIAQTGGIARICGKLSGMYPEDMIEAGKVDQIIDTVTDINELLNPSMRENDPIKKRVMRAELANKDLPNYFGYLEDILNANNSNWFVGGKMSVADIAVWGLLGWIASGVLDDIPPGVINP